MNRLLRFYTHLNTLSIDVALGAVCCCAWFAKLYNVTLRPYAYIALGLTVWIIYTVDHLLDARNIKAQAVTARHRFHQQYFTVLGVLVGFAVMLDVAMIFFVREQVFYAGVILAAIVLLYLLFMRLLSFLKELVVALLYTGGVLLPVLSILGWGKPISHPLVITLFFITALINLLLFAWFDYDVDKQQNYTSFSVQFGKYLTMQFLHGLFLIQAILIATIVLYHQMVWEGLMLFSMNAILFLLFVRFARVFVSQHYRLLGDAVFLIPAIFLAIG